MFNLSKTSIMVVLFIPTSKNNSLKTNIFSWLGKTGRGWKEYSLSQTKTFWKSANGSYPSNPPTRSKHTESRDVVQGDSAHHLWVPPIFASYLFWHRPENSFLLRRIRGGPWCGVVQVQSPHYISQTGTGLATMILFYGFAFMNLQRIKWSWQLAG